MVALRLWIEKNNSRPLVYGESFTKPENFVKIGHVNVEVIGLDRNQYKIKKKHQQNTSPLRLRFAQTGWAKNKTAAEHVGHLRSRRWAE